MNNMEFYYDIKVKTNNSKEFANWSWPPVWSGKIEAENKKEARKLMEKEFDKKFCLRYSEKNPIDYLLSIKEMNEYLSKRFIKKECSVCGEKYTLNDKYITNESGSNDTCSKECSNSKYQERRASFILNGDYLNPPVIYKITNKKTGLIYIGKSIRSFTLRWWEHIKSGKLSNGNTGHKFHDAIKNSSLEDWTYEVIEVIDKYPENLKKSRDKELYIFERETYWIKKFNSINNGYNSLISKKINNQKKLFDE